mmetsp:Transcript_23452/g.52883  ORF Transcript_23452/g.52883 Transcript_23452/m.52883 type:complete len:218 (+) Transcript_23452:119-772(+)
MFRSGRTLLTALGNFNANEPRRRRSLLAAYNEALDTNPYSAKAFSTGVTYVFSDLTAQALEADGNPSIADRARRALTFGAVGCFWVGPLLTKWFFVMDRFVPGKGPAAVATKLMVDQVIQGPFMIGSMFVLTALGSGRTTDQIAAKLKTALFPTWVNSVYVWAPVQIVQQAVVPMKYRVAVANFVSYFWDTYLSIQMMSAPKAARELVRRKTRVIER